MIRAVVDVGSREAEAYRSLRTTLGLSRLTEGHRVVLFTSARRGEGKSTTAANFAVVCAATERPTLLVDADLRNPRLETVFEPDDSSGLSVYLRTGRPERLEDLAVPTDVPCLDLVPAGVTAANAAELLARPAFGELLMEARERYDWVIVDAPPVLPVADAVIVSRVVDGVVLVVDMRRTPLSAARSARDLLRAVDAPVLGVLANNAPAKARSYGYGYGRYPT